LRGKFYGIYLARYLKVDFGGGAKNSEIFKLYNEYDVVTFIELGTLTWAGHVMRIEECDPAKKVVCTKPGGSKYRRKGRQKLT
jgi:hypothetical protein